MYRPHLKLSPTLKERVLYRLAAFLLTANLALPAFFYGGLPPKIPMKFGFQGEPVAWSARGMIWILPGVSVVVAMIFLVLAQVPHLHNYVWEVTEKNAERLYRLNRELLYYMLNGLLLIFLFSTWTVIQVALRQQTGLPDWFLPAAAILELTPMVSYFARGRRIAAEF